MFIASFTTALANNNFDSKQNNTNPVDYSSASSYGTTAELSLSHAPNLGEEAQLTFTVGLMPQLNRTFEDLSAQVVLPEGFTFVSGDLSWQGDLVPGQSVQITSTIKATKTGEWSIGGSIKGAFDYLYVTVSESDSTISRVPYDIPEHDFTPPSSQAQISSTFVLSAGDASLQSFAVPADTDLPNPENLKLRPLSPNLFPPDDPDGITLSENISAESFGGLITIKGYWYYRDQSGTLLPGPRTLVCAFDSDASGAVITFLTKTDFSNACTLTGSNGFFEIGPILNDDGFLQGGYDVFLRFFAINNEMKVSDLSDSVWDVATPQQDNVQDGDVWFPIPPSGQTIFVNLPPTSENSAWQVFYTLYAAWDYLANQGPNFDTSDVDSLVARWDPSACADSFEGGNCFSRGAHYHFAGDYNHEIHLEGRCDPARCSETTGGHASAPDVILHEIGHAVMDYAYENIGGDVPEVENCSPHSIGVNSSPSCAWVEGMATILSLIVGGDSTYDNNLTDSHVEYESPLFFWDPGDADEGFITSTLWDFHDSSNEGLDMMTNGSLDFWDVFTNQQDDSFFEFWTSWKNAGKNTNLAGPTVFHNTINYDAFVPSSPTGWSSSHTVATLSSDITIDVSWAGATDDFSGIQGYSFVFDTNPNTIPDTIFPPSTGTSAESQLLSTNTWYFHVRTIDNDNNWSSSSLHVGPFFIDNCMPPPSGDWIIIQNCTLSSNIVFNNNIKVQNNSVLTIPDGVTLEINLPNKNIIIKSGSGVLIKLGGAMRIPGPIIPDVSIP